MASTPVTMAAMISSACMVDPYGFAAARPDLGHGVVAGAGVLFVRQLLQLEFVPVHQVAGSHDFGGVEGGRLSSRAGGEGFGQD